MFLKKIRLPKQSTKKYYTAMWYISPISGRTMAPALQPPSKGCIWVCFEGAIISVLFRLIMFSRPA